MFLDLSIMGLVGTVTLIILHALMARSGSAKQSRPTNVVSGQPHGLRRVSRGAGWITAATVIVLTCSGWSGVGQGTALTGYTLVVHVTVGTAFALFLVVWVVLRAGCVTVLGTGHSQTLQRWIGLCFWLMVLCSLPLILSIALNLWPLFGMEQQRALAQCHRTSALVFVCTALVYTYLVWRNRRMKHF